MNRLMPSAQALQPSMRAIQCGSIRTLHTTDVRDKNVRAGKKKISTGGKRMKWLTYEEAQPPEMIGVTKSWHSWNTSKTKHRVLMLVRAPKILENPYLAEKVKCQNCNLFYGKNTMYR